MKIVTNFIYEERRELNERFTYVKLTAD